MAIGTPTGIGSAERTASGATLAITTTATVPSGATIISVTTWVAAAARTLALSGGSLTWNSNDGLGTGGSFYGISISSANAPSGLASSSTLTNTWNGNVDAADTFAFYVTGLATASYLDGTPVSTFRSSGLGASYSSGSLTTTNADDLLVGGAMGDWVSATGPNHNGPSGTLTNELYDQLSVNSFGMAVTYAIVAATSSYAMTGLWNPTAQFADMALIVAYKASGGGAGGTTVKQLAALGVG